MKNIFKISLIGIAFLSGCATNFAPNNPVQVAKAPAPMTAIAPVHTGAVAKRLNDCIVNSNQSADALLVDSQIIVVTRNNPHAQASLRTILTNVGRRSGGAATSTSSSTSPSSRTTMMPKGLALRRLETINTR